MEVTCCKCYLVRGSEREDKVDSTPVFMNVCAHPSPDNTQTFTPKNLMPHLSKISSFFALTFALSLTSLVSVYLHPLNPLKEHWS